MEETIRQRIERRKKEQEADSRVLRELEKGKRKLVADYQSMLDALNAYRRDWDEMMSVDGISEVDVVSEGLTRPRLIYSDLAEDTGMQLIRAHSGRGVRRATLPEGGARNGGADAGVAAAGPDADAAREQDADGAPHDVADDGGDSPQALQ